jgi:FtsP/CotA-like multicopper oxidase with cupredoxin domain
MKIRQLAVLTSLIVATLPWVVNVGRAQMAPPQLVPGVNYTLPNYANSPILTKFIDSLPELTPAGANNLGQYLPLAQPMGVNTPAGVPQDGAYYEIAVVDYQERMHSQLGLTTLRGYVQIESPGAATPPGSLHIPLTYLNGAPITVKVAGVATQVYGYDKPHYLGPVIVANKGVSTRIKFYNLLPLTANGGDLFLPTDVTVMGAGMGPLDMPGMPGMKESYTKNRATLHLHGGDNPWVSDGTAHQWIAPAGEATQYPQGASKQNVPDMPLPAVGDGTATFYWPNGLSGRLMFYHDHAYGMTRLDVYAGEAAGYLLVDPNEQALNPAGGQIPLVIQDKTFVNDGTFPAGFLGIPTPATATVDPLWAANLTWGQTKGSLWFPHVYMPNQNPNDITGANMMGRSDYGPWFWPMFPVTQALPQTSHVPEAFMDTPVINGTAYPYVDVQPTAYRLRILNACNDRYMNLQLYVAEPLHISVVSGGTNYSATPTVSIADPTGAGAVATADVVGGVIQKITVTNYGNSAYSAPVVTITDLTGSGAVASASVNTEVRMIPAAKGVGVAGGALTPGTLWPVEWTANDTPGMTPNILDLRASGVPDPSPVLQGPQFVHIGSEGGIKSTPTVMVNTPIGYEQNKRSITVLNTMDHTLFIGPAERADVIVDFSQFAGKTVILYNDSPAPVPAGDPRNDYYTDNLDMRSQGGTAPTVAGFGPNTRTIMQIRVANTAPAQPLGSVTVQAGGSGYTAPVVAITGGGGTGATASATISGGAITGIALTFPGFGYTAPVVSITDPTGSGATATATADPLWGLITSVTVTGGGAGYSAPAVAITNTGPLPLYAATATATVGPAGVISGITLLTPGTGYTSTPLITITDPTGTGAVAVANLSGTVSNPVFDPTTLNAPLATAFAATQPAFIVPSGTYARISDTSMTLNGVPMPLQPKCIQELFDPAGRMNATLGVEVPFTSALIQTTIPYGFIDPATEVIPDGATQLWKITHNGVDTHVIHFHMFNVQVVNRVGWDGAIKPPFPEEMGWKETVKMNPLEDIVVALKAKNPAFPFVQPDNYRPLDPTQPVGPGNVAGFTLVDPNNLPVSYYNKIANFGHEFTWHCHILGHEENDMMRPMMVAVPPAAPSGLVATALIPPVRVRLTWVDNSNNEIGFNIDRATDASFTTGLTTFTVGPNVTTYTDAAVAQFTTYYYRVSATDTVGSGVAGFPSVTVVSGFALTATATTFGLPPAAPSNLVAQASALSVNPPTVTLTWRDNSTNEFGFTIQRATNSAFTLGLTTFAVGANVTTYTDTAVALHTTYYYRVLAFNPAGNSAPSNTARVTTPGQLPKAPSGLAGSAVRITGNNGQDLVTLNWVNNATNATGFQIQRSLFSSFILPSTFNVGLVTTFSQNVPRIFNYYYRIRAVNADGSSAWSNVLLITTP